MISIRYFEDSDEASWDNYVNCHPDGMLFHLTAWKKVVEKTFHHKSYYLIAFSTSNPANTKNATTPSIIGVLPLFHIKSFLFGNYLISVPFAEIGGALSDNGDVEQALLEKARTLAEQLTCDYLELRNRQVVEGFETKDLYYNFKREISPDVDENLTAIPRKARRMIRQGGKHGLTAEFGNHLITEHYDIMARSYHTLGTPVFPKKFFENFIEIFGNDAQILLIRNEEKVSVAAVMTFYYRDQVVPFWAGSRFEYRKLAPNDFMYWQLMKYGCENGYKIFDYGRSKINTGSYHFKRHWGFEPVQLAYQYHLVRATQLPNLSPANPKYQKKIDMWRKLPLFATKLIGPRIAKSLA